MLLKALDTPPEILDDAVRYARVMLVGAPLIFLLWLATSISRGVGDAVSPMWALILATGVALLCTPALIAGWAGLPRLDVLSPAASRCSASRWRWAGWRGAGAAGAIPGAQCCPAARTALRPDADALDPEDRRAGRPADADHGGGRDRAAGAGESTRRAGHGGLWRGDAADELAATARDVAGHQRHHPGRPRHRRRTRPPAGRHRPHRVDDERGGDGPVRLRRLCTGRPTPSACS